MVKRKKKERKGVLSFFFCLSVRERREERGERGRETCEKRGRERERERERKERREERNLLFWALTPTSNLCTHACFARPPLLFFLHEPLQVQVQV